MCLGEVAITHGIMVTNAKTSTIRPSTRPPPITGPVCLS